jgi:prephenate dehydratase
MPKRVAVFGSDDTYAAEIATLLFSDGSFTYTSASKNPCLEVMTKVREGNADVGIVPFWNTHAENEGVPLSYAELAKSGLFVCDIPWLRIELHLASQADSLEHIETVYMMKVVERQCSEFMRNSLPKARIVTADIVKTPEAMDKAMGEKNAAAVGRIEAAISRGLPILSPQGGIQNRGNYTAFFVLSPSPEVHELHDNTLIIARLPNRGGAEDKKLIDLLDNHQTAIIPERQERRDEKVWYIAQVEGRYPADNWAQDCVDAVAGCREFDEVRILGTCHWMDNRVLLTSEQKCVL